MKGKFVVHCEESVWAIPEVAVAARRKIAPQIQVFLQRIRLLAVAVVRIDPKQYLLTVRVVPLEKESSSYC